MKLTLNEWLDLQKNTIRTCEGLETEIPKPLFIGVMTKDETIEANMKLVSASEWKRFQEAWEKISGANHLVCGKNIPRQAPQFFLICN